MPTTPPPRVAGPAGAGREAAPATARLPLPPTSFIGRERELSALHSLLGSTRLLTLTGIGGSGKTRLALELAAHARAARGDAVAWLELASIDDAKRVPAAAAAALGICERPGRSATDVLVDFLESRPMLLVLDDCEHVIDECAELADTLLRACPGLTILATSSQPLGAAGELARPVPPLSLPEHDDVAAIEGSEAGRLFVERGRAVLPAFALTEANAAHVAHVCRRLDGIPLAIELAAARLRALSAGQIAARLDDRFRLLTAGGGKTAPCQRTLRAAMDWSYGLLCPGEQLLLDRLSVFAGAFSLEAAEAVCAGESIERENVLVALASLVEKSLVQAVEPHGAACYRLLETMRRYAAERLAERGETELLLSRRAAFSRTLAEQTPDLALADTPPAAAVARPARSTPPALAVRALGPLEIELEGRTLTAAEWRQAKPRELLLYLLCHPGGRTREQVGVALWPDASAAQVSNRFHVALHHLRKVLGQPEWIQFDGERYAIVPDLRPEFDAAAFVAEVSAALREARLAAPPVDRLRAALALYRGDFLEGEAVGDWHLAQRDRLRRLYVDGLLALGAALFEEAQYAEAAELYRRVTVVEDLHEEAHRRLILCCARSGERPAALRHYCHFARLLMEELGTAPATETTTLYERLQRGEAV